MHTITVKNVNEALPIGITHLRAQGVQRPSRNGRVLESPGPVATRYTMPEDNILLCPVRRANPYFHLYEAMWILAGRDDVASLTQFNARMAEFSDNGHEFHGAYGQRLRHAEGDDQLTKAVSMLERDPESRRVVCSIWDPIQDLDTKSKDIPCNTHLYFLVRDDALTMTVNCRSNDVIWGAYGANAVQFSMILQYMAGMTGYRLGTLWQISNSFHAYTEMEGNPWGKLCDHYAINGSVYNPFGADAYLDDFVRVPLIKDRMAFDQECAAYVSDPFAYSPGDDSGPYYNTFFSDVAVPMAQAWRARKDGDPTGEDLCIKRVKDSRWRAACEMWRATAPAAVPHG